MDFGIDICRFAMLIGHLRSADQIAKKTGRNRFFFWRAMHFDAADNPALNRQGLNVCIDPKGVSPFAELGLEWINEFALQSSFGIRDQSV